MDITPFLTHDRIFMLALDHRGSLEAMLPKDIKQADRRDTVISVKRMLMKALASQYSGVLIDSDYGLPAYESLMDDPAVAVKPYLLCIEKTGYTDTDHERLTNLEYTVAELKAKGAKGVKILLFFHPGARSASAQIALTKEVYRQCQENGLPFFLEILNYPLTGTEYAASELVPKSVKIFLESGIHAEVFKLEFPGTAESCREVTSLLGQTPWILLTKGETYETFKAGLAVATEHGARGFLAGRSIWQDFAQLPRDKWEEFFATTVAERFSEICVIARS